MKMAVVVLSLSLPLAISCASGSPFDEAKAQTVLGRHSDVRVTAEIVGDRGDHSSAVRVVCRVENLRPDPIEIAMARSESTWDPASQVYTVTVGSELPVEDSSMLVTLAPNEKKEFYVSAPLRSPKRAGPSRKMVRVKLYFLDRPLAAVKNLGSDVWEHWVQAKQTVVTNAIPIGTSLLSTTTDSRSAQR